MLSLLGQIKNNVLDILFPKFCIGCGKEGLYICKDCEVFLSEVEPSTTDQHGMLTDATFHVNETMSAHCALS